MSGIQEQLKLRIRAFGADPLAEFLLTYGFDYAIGPQTFAGPRGTPKECFHNAAHLAIDNPALTYCEGKIAVHGVAIDHAWCIDGAGVVVDPTLTQGINGDFERVLGYFGVPFITEYVCKAALRNGRYCLLDGYYARETLPKLLELGHLGGMQWLLQQPRNRKNRK